MSADELPVTGATFDEFPLSDSATVEKVNAILAHNEASRAFADPDWLAKLIDGAA